MEATHQTCRKLVKKNYAEMRVEIEPGYMGCHFSDEGRRLALEAWAKEVHEFLRDHRSMDVNSVRVILPEYDACSACGDRWETCEFDEDEDFNGDVHAAYTGCANCGVPVETAIGKDCDS
jgi:hypothetical protein